MPLKTILAEHIRTMGYVSYGDVANIALEEGYKISTAERRLRELMSPKEGEAHIEAVIMKSKRGSNYIGAYRYVGEPIQGSLV